MKFKIAGKEVFRSKTIHKNLNPVWDERVSLLVETLRDPLYVKVHTCNLFSIIFKWKPRLMLPDIKQL